jgi:outer membrane protein
MVSHLTRLSAVAAALSLMGATAPVLAQSATQPASSAPAQSTQPTPSPLAMTGPVDGLLDVIHVIERARQNDPQVGAVRREHDAVLLAPDEARAGLLPQLQASTSSIRNQQKVLSTENEVYRQGAATYPTRTLGMTLTVPLMRLAAWRKLDQAKASTRQSAFALEAAELDVITRAVTAYITVLAARDALGLATAESEAIAAQLRLVRAKRQAGQVAQHVLSEVVGRYEMRQAEILAAENEMRDRMLALSEIVGPLNLRPSQLPVLRQDAVLPRPDPDNVQDWVERALAQNSQLKARRIAAEVAQAEISRHRAGYAPTLDLVVSYNRRNAGGSLYGGGSDVSSNDTMVNLVYPLYEGGVTNALVVQAVHRHSAALLEVERLTRQVDRQARTLFSSLQAGAKRELAIRASVQAMEDTRTHRTAAFRNGLTTVTAVLDAERDLSGALRDLAQVRYDQVLNMVKLKQLVATLGNEDFPALVSLFGAAPATSPTSSTSSTSSPSPNSTATSAAPVKRP